MPISVGFFGKGIKNNWLLYNRKYSTKYNNNKGTDGPFINLGSYLAGLIEGDGTIAIYDKTSKSKKYRPLISIVFKRNDLYLAQFLCKLTKCGRVENKVDRGYIL